MSQTLYQECVEKGIPIDNHESDLYVQDCPEAREILSKHATHFTVFKSDSDGKEWLDIPFLYDPWWDARRPLS